MLVKTKRLTSVHHYDPNSSLFSGFTTFSLMYVFSSQIQFKMSHYMAWLSFTADRPPLCKCSLLCTFPSPHIRSCPKGTPVFLMIIIPLPQTYSNVNPLCLPGLMKNIFCLFLKSSWISPHLPEQNCLLTLLSNVLLLFRAWMFPKVTLMWIHPN